MSSQYKSSTALQGLQAATAKSATFATVSASSGGGGGALSSSSSGGGLSNPNERRYWSTKYGLGPSKHVPSARGGKGGGKGSATAPTRVHFSTTSNAPVSSIVFSPKGTANHQLAVVAGPRVALYGPGGNSALGRGLSIDGSNNKRGGGGGGGEPNLFGANADPNDDSNLDDDIRPDRTVGTGGHLARCASYRRDGRLIAVGTDAGEVRVCDVTSRATLRTFRPSSPSSGQRQGRRGGYPVRAVVWLGDGKRLVSGGDDGIVRVWELSGKGATGGGDSDGPLLTMTGHGDSVRCVAVLRVKAGTSGKAGKKAGDAAAAEARNLVVSGGYDHTVRVWDVDATATTGGGATVPLIVSAGGTVVKVWNPLTGRCVTTVKTMHSKTITALCLMDIVRNDDDYDASDAADRGGKAGKKKAGRITNRRLLTAGLDGLVRIYSADDVSGGGSDDGGGGGGDLKLPYLHGIKTPHPITALRSSPDGTRLVIGTSTGLLTVRQRGKIIPQGVSLKRKSNAERKLEPGTYSYFMRGANVNADADDHVVLIERKKRMRSYDVMLRQFRYGDALDEALRGRTPDVIMAVLEELGKRRGLTQSLSNRDEETLEPILAFTARYIVKPRYTPVLIGVADKLCDIYGGVVGQSEVIDEHFDKLRRHVGDECRVQRTLLRLVGQIDSVMCAAEMAAATSSLEEEE